MKIYVPLILAKSLTVYGKLRLVSHVVPGAIGLLAAYEDRETARNAFHDAQVVEVEINHIGEAQGESVMMLQSRLAEAEQRAERAEAEADQAEADADRLREALSALYAAQNGPPLIRDAEEWKDAMTKAREALGREVVDDEDGR